MTHTILIVDDDPAQRRILEEVVKRDGYRAITAQSGQEALDKVMNAGTGASEVAMVILDLIMPEMDGMEVLERLRPTHPSLPVIVLTAHGGIETVVKAMRAGADDFVVKPVSPERLHVSIRNALKVTALTGEISRLQKKKTGALTFDDIIAGSPAMTNVLKLGKRAAQSTIPVLIEGESGVGKEVVAAAIQGESARVGAPFITVNCGALPENLVESILFGHEKGAFTGANEKHAGKFVEANGGTLFLDEIGELPLDMQVKLLRAIQEGEVDPVGAKKPVKVDIRLISATNRDLIQMVKDGDFREDLFYRLNVFPMTIPPLRQRKDDLPALIAHFTRRLSAEEGKPVMGIAPDALNLLSAFDWPGNVRQLENTIFRAVVLCDGDMLSLADFPQIASQVEGFEQALLTPDLNSQMVGQAAPQTPGSQMSEPSAMIGDNSRHTLADFARSNFGSSYEENVEVTDDTGNMRKLEDIEADLIRLAIEKYKGHMSEVARRLGIGRSTLYRKVRELGLDVRGD
ncbi:MAG: DNA-binding NtrC family response regulator [Parvibaculaceae bacterium]|jgi:DNA-binding NtrC family response regulator|nr:sigma-54 dependent transcriptional regulator [Parvibaculaceae bacterium]